VPITYFDLPTRGSIMHRIIAPGTERSKLKNIWFTELGADRIGTVKLSKKRKGPSTAFQDQDQDQDQAA